MLEVDQSGKIGDTKNPTILAYSNHIEKAIFIPATVKRQCVQILRSQGMSGGTMYLFIFVRGLYLLLADALTDGEIVLIDEEYPGHEREIKQQLLNLCKRDGISVEPSNIRFGRIGKKSNAHYLALGTLQGARKPTCQIGLDELMGIM
ncbi:MAG: hypothetical protein HUU38_01550 [Anaerolineales bacterium]|nr:hypothetical protein [Anaerolineales bacterium]